MAGNSRPEAQSLLKEACIIDYSGFVNESERPEKICDDDEKTKWCDTNRSPNYLTFDLGSVRPVSRWHLLNAGSEMPAYITRTCILQGRSNDQEESVPPRPSAWMPPASTSSTCGNEIKTILLIISTKFPMIIPI